MHDLTNCIRTHDYSIFHDGHLSEIVELKIRESGRIDILTAYSEQKLKGRASRQMARLKKVLKYIETGDLGQLYPEFAGGRAIKSNVFEKHNFEAISDAIRAARRNGYGFSEPEKGVLYLVWHQNKSTVDEAITAATKAHSHIFDSIFTFRSISPRYDAYNLSLPITAMDLPVKDIIDILFGKVAVICIVNFSILESFCQEKGVPLSIEKNETGKTVFRVISKKFEGQVMDGLWDRVMLEGLSLKSFVGLVKDIINNYPNE